MDSDCSEKKAFLSSSSDQLTTPRSDSFDAKLPSRRAPFYRLDFVLHLVLITLYTFAALSFVRSNSNQGQCLHSPNGMTDLNFIYTPQRFTAFQDSPFTGSPGPESDRAWHDLLSNMSVRVSREELERGNQTSVELPGGGYMAWLGVFHELHCVVSTALGSFLYSHIHHSLSNTHTLEDAAAMEISRLLPCKPDPRGRNAQ